MTDIIVETTTLSVEVVSNDIVVTLIGGRGAVGQGIPTGGTNGQILAKASGTDYDTHWIAQAAATVTSVAGRTGAVVLTADDTPDGTTNKAYTATEKTKLAGIATGATANSSDATLLARANHTGTQLAATISDFTASASAAAPVQSVAGRTGTVVLTSSDVSLGNVSNVAQLPLSYLDTDATLAANSDAKVASQKAIKAYADGLIAAANATVYKGATDCSGNPNFPAADAGWLYRVSVTGKIGGASGIVVEAGDMFICLTDGTTSGTQAAVGANWNVIQANIDGAVIGPASSTDNALARFDGTTGKLIQNSGVTADDSGNLTANNLSGTNTGDQTNISGNAATVTTNANMTGPITSVGNATSVAAQTGTGSIFAMKVSPAFTTPDIGVATGTSLVLTSTSATAFAVGPGGSTNPGILLDASASNAVTGIVVTMAAAGSGATVSSGSSASNENITYRAKGTGTVSIGGNTSGSVSLLTSTGNINLTASGTATITLKTNNTARYTSNNTAHVFATDTNATAATAHFKYTSAATDTGRTAGAEGVDVLFDLSHTSGHASNTTVALQRDFSILSGTHAFASATGTETDGATFCVDGGPSAGSNAILTNSHAIYVPTKALAGTVTNGYGINIAAPTGASNNYAAKLGGVLFDGSGTVTGAASITSTTFVGALTGNASTASAVAASALTGNTLAAGVTGSSLTSFGTVTSGTLNGVAVTGLSSPVGGSDAATKAYVDAATSGLTPKASCRLATTANLTGVYLNGTAGVGATFTYTATGVDTIDGVTLVAADRVLLKNQTSTFQNGIYTVTLAGSVGVAGILTRATDFDSATTEVVEGAHTVIEEGTANAGTLWIETGQGPFTMGTTAITFTELTVAPQTITFTGNVTGTGAGSIALTIGAAQVTNAMLSATIGSGAKVPLVDGTPVIASGKTATINNTLTFTGTDSSTVACGAGGTIAYVANKLSVFAATSSAELAGVISDETGSGALCFATSPTFTTVAAASTFTAGSGSGTFKSAGVISSNVTPASNVSTSETDLMTYALPASSLTAGKIVKIKAWGTGANNANAKTLKAYLGATVMISSSISISVLHQWWLEATIVCTATDAETYFALFSTNTAASAVAEANGMSTATEATGSSITLKVTGTGGASSDITQNGMIVEFAN